MKTVMAILFLVPSAQDADLGKRLRETYVAAADHLMTLQDAKGAWSAVRPDRAVPSVAYTSLLVAALARAPQDLRAKYRPNVERAAGFLLSKANSDGSF